ITPQPTLRLFPYTTLFRSYCKERLKQLLHERYGEHIYFASRPGGDDVMGFSKYVDLILHSKYFSDRSDGDGTEAERIVNKAAGLDRKSTRLNSSHQIISYA